MIFQLIFVWNGVTQIGVAHLQCYIPRNNATPLHQEQRIMTLKFLEQRVTTMLIKRVASETYRLKKMVRGSRNIKPCLPTVRQPGGEASCMNEQHSYSLHLQMTFLSNAATPISTPPKYYTHSLQKDGGWGRERSKCRSRKREQTKRRKGRFRGKPMKLHGEERAETRKSLIINM